MEIIITTPFHVKEVETFVAGMNKDIIDMSLEPKMETIVELARIESDNRVGLICQSENFVSEVHNSLNKIGLDNFNFNYTLKKGDELEFFLEEHDILITSPHRYSEIYNRIGEVKKVINFEYTPDRGSINMLKMALLDLKAV